VGAAKKAGSGTRIVLLTLEGVLNEAHATSRTTDAALDAYRDARIAGLESALAMSSERADRDARGAREAGLAFVVRIQRAAVSGRGCDDEKIGCLGRSTL
jgi:hypothetical protein